MLIRDRMFLQAGGGIVKDSDPRREYEETINKSRRCSSHRRASLFKNGERH